MRRPDSFLVVLYPYDVIAFSRARREHPFRRRNLTAVAVNDQELGELVAHGNDVRAVTLGDAKVNHLLLQVEIRPFQGFDAALARTCEECGKPPHTLDRSESFHAPFRGLAALFLTRVPPFFQFLRRVSPIPRRNRFDLYGGRRWFRERRIDFALPAIHSRDEPNHLVAGRNAVLLFDVSNEIPEPRAIVADVVQSTRLPVG